MEVQGCTIVAREVGGNAKDIAKSAHDIFAKGRYDLMIVVADNPTAANLAFNKYGDIDSAVCHDSEDAKDVKDNGIRALIVKDSNVNNVEDIISTYIRGGGLKLNIKIPQIPKKLTAEPPQRAEEDEDQSKPAVLIHHPCHDLRICVYVRGRNVNLRAYHLSYRPYIPS